MYCAITTKYFGPTNSRGSRVKAKCDAGSVTVAWNYSLGIPGNHRAAAKALADKMGRTGAWVGGSIGEGYAFVLGTVYPSDGFTVAGQ
jgi:hypothetical protein